PVIKATTIANIANPNVSGVLEITPGVISTPIKSG
ncbi:unnamed protein product, partial [marine sediment metagenome]